ncbi:hypothetical protein OO013_10860 [Mangrovivirga sp. M17]|uniref:Uncharacterized protein n=1 Tax=Mangrovivirga halotolerans TaxID=2993936 RepID=A0ABT3RTA2_9BACT|nr:hypothetical protein [Mangrovivirga halotolerans]MCX2744370.1 hypothetical protein [Mangrovivirga halotolerans]
MKHLFLTLILFFFSVGISFGQEGLSLEKATVSENIQIKIPEGFSKMTDDELYAKYRSADPAAFAYISADKQAEFTINSAETPWPEEDIELLYGFYKATIYDLFDEINILKEETIDLDGKKVAVLEMETVVYPPENSIIPRPTVRKYNYIQYFIHDGKVWIMSFSSPQGAKQNWKEIIEISMESIKLKKPKQK